MNQLSLDKRTQIIALLVEGNSLRSTTRLTGCSINTVTKLLVDVGRACEEMHDKTVKNLQTKRVEADEIWSFVYAKAKNVPVEKLGEAGDIWTWTAIDSDSKLMISWLVGDRSRHSCFNFLNDVKSRLGDQRIQMSTDGLGIYTDVVNEIWKGQIDYAQIIKKYAETNQERGFRPKGTSEVIATEKTTINGNPENRLVSTSYVERQNLTMRMGIRRFGRQTNAFSKKVENHWLAVALHFAYYNFCRIHKTLRVTPAMAAGLTKRPWEIADLVMLTENADYSRHEL